MSVSLTPHFSHLAFSSRTLTLGNVAQLHVGVHVDGFTPISTDALAACVSPEEPIAGQNADVIKATYPLWDAMMRPVRVVDQTWMVSDTVGKIASAFDSS